VEDGLGSRASIEAIRRNAERLDAMVADLLWYSRLDNVPPAQGWEDVDLAALCEWSGATVRVTAEASGSVLTLERPEGPVEVSGSALELGRVVDNLVGNAVKYTPSGGTISVAVRPEGDDVVLSVRDDGVGITAEDMESLFIPFARGGNPETQALPGTGLGLAIADRIVRRHHGLISVDSKPGEGSTFTVRLPRAGSPA
jgi:signal transduction histidine kinase